MLKNSHVICSAFKAGTAGIGKAKFQEGTAMGIMDKFKSFMGVPDDEFLEDEEEEDYGQDSGEEGDEYAEEEDYTAVGNTRRASFLEPDPAPSYRAGKDRDSKVVNIHATVPLQEVVLAKPEHFEDATGIADHLNAKRTVLINLETASQDVKRRLVDFLSGVAYANRGQIKRVANSTFIITPYSVEVIGDSLLDELENNGVYF
jgi:cell division inhibitor SepF